MIWYGRYIVRRLYLGRHERQSGIRGLLAGAGHRPAAVELSGRCGDRR